jgi:hypothetical protein
LAYTIANLSVRIHAADRGIYDGPKVSEFCDLFICQFNPMLCNNDGDFLRMPERPTYRNGMLPIMARVSRRPDAIPSDGMAIHFLDDRSFVFPAHELTAHADAEIKSVEHGGLSGITFPIASAPWIGLHPEGASLDCINI